MRRSMELWKYLLTPSAVGILLYGFHARATDPAVPPTPNPASSIQLVQEKQKDAERPKQAETPKQPDLAPRQPDLAPRQPETPTAEAPRQPEPGMAPAGAQPSGIAAALFGGALGSTQGGAATTQTSAGTQAAPGSAGVGGEQAQGRASSDVGDLLGRAPAATGVEVQRRNPIVTDPRVRGYHQGQLLTQVDGAFVVPSRQDLDTIISKIDANALRNVVVIKGPFSVLYGPGFSFIDVITLGTERYEQGTEGHSVTSLLYKTNGDQWRGRQGFYGGGPEWGFRIGYDLFSGVDYRSGNGTEIPSSYNSQNVDFAFGYNFSPDSRLELRVFRQDQQNVEFPGQAFDIRYLISDGYIVNYELKDQELFDKMTFDAWYFYTRFNGDNFAGERLLPSKLRQIPQLADPTINLVGFTDANVESPGFRWTTTWGEDQMPQFRLGVDLRYVTQKLNEYDRSPFQLGTFNNPIPRSHANNPGIFFDLSLPVSPALTVKAGARFDWVNTDIDQLPPGPFRPLTRNPQLGPDDPALTLLNPAQDPAAVTALLQRIYGTSNFQNDYDLWGAFLTAEYKLTDQLTPFINFGMAQRPPTLTELYAAGPFLAVVQNGLNSVVGNPLLAPEQNWQVDFGLRANYERFRGGFNLFYAWIHNYITYEVLQAAPFQVLRFVNTDWATLSGFEWTAEYDLTDYVTPFATMTYVEGRDQTRDRRGSLGVIYPTEPAYIYQAQRAASLSNEEPLPGIPPMETRLGLRFHNAGQEQRWGIETAARIVMAQGRIAASLQEQKTPGFTTFDIRTFWQANKNLLLTAGVENFLDRNYREHLDLRTGTIPIPRFDPQGQLVGYGPTGPGVLQPGINFYVGAQLTY